jgi:BTB/POZ domain
MKEAPTNAIVSFWQMFEAPAWVLQRDAGSLLAQLCAPQPPITPDPEGFFYFDRDWWLFRHIMTFMRDGTLPEDRLLLSQVSSYTYVTAKRLTGPFITQHPCRLSLPSDT